MIGREKIPKIFKKYNVVDYANSKFSSFVNDIKIFHISDFQLYLLLVCILFHIFKEKISLYQWMGFSENLGHNNSLQ